MKIRTRKNEKYFGEFEVGKNGSLKIKFVKKSVGVNQYKRSWKNVDRKGFKSLLERREIKA